MASPVNVNKQLFKLAGASRLEVSFLVLVPIANVR